MQNLTEENKYQHKIITIPNIISTFRILLIPLIVWVYLVKESYLLAGVLVVFSCFTDMVDGWIARGFHMISDVGKVLDPIADKSTQLVVALLLATRFPLIIIPIVITVIKEIFMAVTGYMVIKKCGIVLAAEWYGKMATVVLMSAIALLLFWYEIPPVISTVLIIASAFAIALSLVLYAIRNLRLLRK